MRVVEKAHQVKQCGWMKDEGSAIAESWERGGSAESIQGVEGTARRTAFMGDTGLTTLRPSGRGM